MEERTSMTLYRYIGRNRRNPRGLSIPNGTLALGLFKGDTFKVQLHGRLIDTYYPEAFVYKHGKCLGDWAHGWHETNRKHWVKI